MNAKLEIGEVSLTATIGEVFGQFIGAVVARDAAARYQIGELITRNRGQLRGLAKRQNALSVKGKSEFRP
jgi:hypothetical protein